MKFEILISKRVAKSIKNDIPKEYILKILTKIEELSLNPFPSNSKKLVGFSDLWRIREGDYRIIYSADKEIQIIEVLRVGYRKDVYNKK